MMTSSWYCLRMPDAEPGGPRSKGNGDSRAPCEQGSDAASDVPRVACRERAVACARRGAATAGHVGRPVLRALPSRPARGAVGRRSLAADPRDATGHRLDRAPPRGRRSHRSAPASRARPHRPADADRRRARRSCTTPCGSPTVSRRWSPRTSRPPTEPRSSRPSTRCRPASARSAPEEGVPPSRKDSPCPPRPPHHDPATARPRRSGLSLRPYPRRHRRLARVAHGAPEGRRPCAPGERTARAAPLRGGAVDHLLGRRLPAGRAQRDVLRARAARGRRVRRGRSRHELSRARQRRHAHPRARREARLRSHRHGEPRSQPRPGRASWQHLPRRAPRSERPGAARPRRSGRGTPTQPEGATA